MAFDLIDELAGVISALETESIPYAVCGGLALGILGYPRATIDIDVLIAPGDVDRAKLAVRSAATLLTVDLLLAGEELVEVFQARMEVPWRGKAIWVVTREGLATMKKLAGRPRDLADLAMLEGRAEDEADEEDA